MFAPGLGSNERMVGPPPPPWEDCEGDPFWKCDDSTLEDLAELAGGCVRDLRRPWTAGQSVSRRRWSEGPVRTSHLRPHWPGHIVANDSVRTWTGFNLETRPDLDCLGRCRRLSCCDEVVRCRYEKGR